MPRNAFLPEGSVLLVTEPVNPGGLAIYTSSLMQGLSEAAIPHLLLTSTRPGYQLLPKKEFDYVKISPSLFWSVWRPFAFRRLVAWARDTEPLLVHGLSAITAPLCAHLAQALQVPYTVTVHHFQRRGSLRADKHCQGIIAVSEPLRENIVNEAGISKELVRVIPAGIRIPVEPRTVPAQNAAGQSAPVPLISTFGKLIPRKDIRTFLRMARLVVDRLGRECSFIVSGEGPEESALRKFAHELQLDKQVTFCHGSAEHAQLLRDTDVYVQCSKAEGFGSMVLQAMAHGVPVVATSTGGMLSLIKDGETGYLVPAGDAEALAAKTLELLAEPERAGRVGLAAQQAARESYSLEAMMTGTLELYAEAVVTSAITK